MAKFKYFGIVLIIFFALASTVFSATLWEDQCNYISSTSVLSSGKWRCQAASLVGNSAVNYNGTGDLVIVDDNSAQWGYGIDLYSSTIPYPTQGYVSFRVKFSSGSSGMGCSIYRLTECDAPGSWSKYAKITITPTFVTFYSYSPASTFVDSYTITTDIHNNYHTVRLYCNNGNMSLVGGVTAGTVSISNSDVINLWGYYNAGETGTYYIDYFVSESTDSVSDNIAPASVTDLAVSTMTTSSATLAWTAPGDDGTMGQASYYQIKYSSIAMDCLITPDPKQGATILISDGAQARASSDQIDYVEVEKLTSQKIHVKIRWYPSSGGYTTSSGVHLTAHYYDGSTWHENIYTHLMIPSDFIVGTWYIDEFDYDIPPDARIGTSYIRACIIDRANSSDQMVGHIASGSSGTAIDSSRHFDNADVDFSLISMTWDNTVVWKSSRAVAGASGFNEMETITGLVSETSYYFRVWTADETPNWSEISNGTTVWMGTFPPGRITNLQASAGNSEGEILLTWMATGDDGTIGNIIGGKYRIEYTQDSGASWGNPANSSIQFSTNVIANNWQRYTIEGLTFGGTYYFWLKICDDIDNNWSELSNMVTSYVRSFGVLVSYNAYSPSVGYNNNNARRLVRDSVGNLYLAYTKYYSIASSTQVYVSKSVNNGQTWQDIDNIPIQIISGCTQYAPALVIDSSDNVHCVWYSNSSGISGSQIKYSKYNGTSWSSWVNISVISGYNQYCPAIDVDSNNNLHVVWHGYDSTSSSYYQIKYSSYTVQNGIWSNWINISPIANYSQYNPSITVDLENKLYVVWNGMDIENRSYSQIKYSKKTGLGWSNWININPASQSQYTPSIAIDGNNGLHVAYYTDSYPFRILYTSYTAGTGWSNTEIVYSTYSSYQYNPSIVIDKNNKLHILWYGYISPGGLSDFRIRYSTRNITGWSSAAILTNMWSENVTARWQNYNTRGGNLDFSWTYPNLNYVCFNQNTSVELATGAVFTPPIPDSVIPANIVDLSVSSITISTISLVWTAVGDDGSVGNIINGWYCIKYSTNSADGWSAINSITISTNTIPGRREKYTLTGLGSGTTYYFWIKTIDDSLNWSELSNITTGYTSLFISVYGYTLLNRQYYWDDNIGIKQSWGNFDDTNGTVNLPFAFSYCSHRNYSAIYPNTNGWIGLSSPITQGLQDSILVFNWDLYADGGGTEGIYVSTRPTECLITWDTERYGSTPRVIMQCIMKNNGNILFNWKTLEFTGGTCGLRDILSNATSYTPVQNSSMYYRIAVDVSSPSAINDLTAINTGFSQAYLRWSSPGDDGSFNYLTSGSEFLIQYSTNPSMSWLSDNAQIRISTNTILPGTQCNKLVSVMGPSTTYYFRVWTKDDDGLISEISNGTSVYLIADISSPIAVSNLIAMSPAVNRVNLYWTAPGDNGNEGNISGGRYHIKYSTNMSDNWLSTTGILISTDIIAGQMQMYSVTPLNGGTTYYFWLKTSDNLFNWSELSNTATVYITALYGNMVSTGPVNSLSLAYNNARRLVRDSTGNLYLAYYRNYTPVTADQIFVAKSADNGQTWQDIDNVPIQTISGSQNYPSLVVDSSDNVHCVWSGNNQIRYSKYNGTSWSSWVNISTVTGNYPTYPAIDVDSNNNLHIVCSNYNSASGSYQIKYSSYTVQTGVWSDWSIIFSITNYPQYNPAISVDSENKIHVVWNGADFSSNSYDQIKYINKINSGWSNWININPVGQTQNNPSIVIDSNNGLHVVYCGYSSYRILYTSYTVEMGWSSGEIVYVDTSCQQYNPSLVIDKNNNLHVLWYGYTGSNLSSDNYRIKYSSRSTNGWSNVNIFTNVRSDNITARWQNYNTRGGNVDFAWTYPNFSYAYFSRDISVELSNGALFIPPIPDYIAPSSVTDLDISTTTNGTVRLVWTAVGDDGSIGNIRGGRFYIKYSTNSVDNWNANNSITISTNSVPGRRETFTITGFNSGTTYYFLLRTADEVNNLSGLSNIATGYTTTLYGNVISTGPIYNISTANNNARRLVRDSMENLYLTYYKRYPSANADQIFVAKSGDDGQTWQDIGNAPIHVINSRSQQYPSLVIDSNDNLHCVWFGQDPSGGYSQIKYSKYDGTNWSSWVNISTVSGNQYYPAIDIDSYNNLHVVWHGYDPIHSGYSQIKYSSYTAQTGVWSDWVNISSVTGYNQYNPSISVDSENKLHVVWYGRDSGSNVCEQIKYSQKTSSGWSNWTNVNSVSQYQYSPSIVVDSKNGLHIAYYTTTLPYRILYTSSTSGTGWGSAEAVYSDTSSYQQYNPSIVIDKNDSLHVLWYGCTGPSGSDSFRIRYSSRNTNSWLTARILTNMWSENVTVRWQNYSTNGGNLDFAWTYPNMNYICYNNDNSILISTGLCSTIIPVYSTAPTLSCDMNISATHIRWLLMDNANNEQGLYISSATSSGARLSGNFGPLTDIGNMISWTETNLIPNTVYTRYAEAYRTRVSSYSDSLVICTLPEKVTDFAVVNVTTYSVTFNWSNVRASKYCVEYSVITNTGTWIPVTMVSTNSYLHTNLSAGSTYFWRLFSINVQDRINPEYSNIISTITLPLLPSYILPPAVPTEFTGSMTRRLGELSINWEWLDNANNESGYRIRNSTGGVVADLSANTTYYIEYNLMPNTSYYRYLESYNANGSVASSAIICKYVSPPPTPANLLPSTIYPSSIVWSWNDVSSTEDGFRVRASSNNGIVADLSPNVSSYNHINLAPNTSYSIYVEVYDFYGATVSPSVVAYTLANPATGSYFVNATINSIEIAWLANDNPSNTVYEVQYSTDTNFVNSVSTMISDSRFTISGLTAETSYSFKIRAINGDNVPTDWSTIISTETVGIPPDPPSGLNVEALPGVKMRINWDRSVSEDIGSYRIYWKDAEDIDYEVYKASVSYPANEYTTEELIPDKLYYFVVRAVDKKGNEEKNKFVVSVSAYEYTPLANNSKMVVPSIGKKLGGDCITLVTDIPNPQNIKSIEFQYKSTSSVNWSTISLVSGYTVQWDIKTLPEGQYNVRAVVINTQGQKDELHQGYSTIIVDQSDPDIKETKPGGTDYEITQRINPLINNTVFIQNSSNKIVITTGTFSQSDKITVTVNPITRPDGNENLLSANSCWEINLSSVTFLLKPVTLQMSYRDDNDDGLIDGVGTKVKDLAIYSYSGGKWVKIIGNKMNKTSKIIETNVTHFSYYAMYVEIPLNMDNVHCYPNPYKPSIDVNHSFGVRFTEMPKATTRIKVFNVAGEMVYDSGDKYIDIGSYDWMPGEEISSGLYIYLITNDQGQKKKGKFTIIR